MELRLNKYNVTHIKLYDEQKGRVSYWHGYLEYVWMEIEYFKFLWLFKTPIVNYTEGYYIDCKRKWITNDNPTEPTKNEFVRDKVLFTLPRIEIFAGKEEIKTMYFKDYEQAKNYVTDNYPNVNVVC